MASGRSADFLVVDERVIATAKLVDNQLLVNAKLGAKGVELKDNTLFNKPHGWDSQADDNNLEIVNEHRNPVFQLTYLTGNTAAVRGVFFNQAESLCVVVDEERVLHATAADIATIKIKPIFKYPSWKYPKERQ